MSVLRILSPLRSSSPRRAGPSKESSRQDEAVSLRIQLPTFGTIFMKPPIDPLWPHARTEGPRQDQIFCGVLEIRIPRAAAGTNARRRCKAIRVGVRTKSRLNMGPGRGWEEDTIFERKVEMIGGNSDGILLDEGIQRFEFTLILPSTFAPHDWHHNGKVQPEIFAELEGLPEPEPSSALSMFGLGRRNPTRSAPGFKAPSRSSSPGPAHNRSLSPMIIAAASLSITRQEDPALALVPSYEQSQAASGVQEDPRQGDDWIVGTHEEVKSIMVFHNPNPTGNFSDLDSRQSGIAPGIGAWDLKIFSDVFSIGGPIHARLTLPSLSPKVTIFSWRLLVRQTHTITSPRDDPETSKPHSSSRVFDIIQCGVKPEQGVRRPGLTHPAVWRGKEAGGEDDGECMTSGTAYMPKDDRGRPTTLPGIITPIKVSHTFIHEVYFSVWGEDDQGERLLAAGPGGLRFLHVTKPLLLPSCALIPDLLELPIYTHEITTSRCVTCGKTAFPAAQICTSCPDTSVPHRRHDIKFAKATLEEGYCQACCQVYDLLARGGWQAAQGKGSGRCACGLGAEDIALRMGRFATEGITISEGLKLEESRMSQKQEDERGRRGRSSDRE